MPSIAKDSANVQCTSRLSGPMLSRWDAARNAMRCTSLIHTCRSSPQLRPLMLRTKVMVHLRRRSARRPSDRADQRRHPKGPGLRLLDLDGRFLRTIAAGQLRNPQAVAASHGRAFVVDRKTSGRRGRRGGRSATFSMSSTSTQATSCNRFASTWRMQSLQSLWTATRSTSQASCWTRSWCSSSRGPRRETSGRVWSRDPGAITPAAASGDSLYNPTGP